MDAPTDKPLPDFSESDPEGRPFSDFKVPTRADYTRGTFPDGKRVRFLSKHLIEPWPLPIPGRSLIQKTARGQKDPANTGSIYTPPKGTSCRWMPDECVAKPSDKPKNPELEAKIKDGKRLLQDDAMARFERCAAYHERVITLGEKALDLIGQSPELLLQYAMEGAAAAEPEPTIEPATATPAKASGETPQPRAEVQHDLGQLTNMLEKSQREIEAASASSAGILPAQAKPESQPRVQSTPEGLRGETPQPPDIPSLAACAQEPSINTAKPQTPRAPRPPRLPYVKSGTLGRLTGLIALGSRSADKLSAVTTKILELGSGSYDHAGELDAKELFFGDRAWAVIKDKLCAIDHEFEDLGFGGWMPFRYIDQWLQFVSLERKLMAANDLICPGGPNHWRKFIEETPEVPNDDDAYGKTDLPKAWGILKKNQNVDSLSECFAMSREKTGRSPKLAKIFEGRFGKKNNPD